jgi:transposase-like protein
MQYIRPISSITGSCAPPKPGPTKKWGTDMKNDVTEKEQPEPAEDDYKRWTAKRKAAVVLDLIKGLTTPAEVARKHALTVAEVESWVEAGLKGMEDRLRSNPRDNQAEWEAEKKELYAKIGELTLEKEILKKTHRVLGKDLPEGIS